MENLILIPGFGCDERLWRHQIEHLSDIASIETIIAEGESRGAMAEAILARAPEKFVLAGHSLGGWVAQEIAASAPDRVRKLILVATWTRYNEPLVEAVRDFQGKLREGDIEPYLRDNLNFCLHPDRLSDTELTEAIVAMELSIPRPVLAGQSQAMIADNEALSLLDSIVCPTLVIYGRQDKIFPIEEGIAIADRIRGARGVIIEDCGHMIPMERPRALTALFRFWMGD